MNNNELTNTLLTKREYVAASILASMLSRYNAEAEMPANFSFAKAAIDHADEFFALLEKRSDTQQS